MNIMIKDTRAYIGFCMKKDLWWRELDGWTVSVI